MSPLNAQEPMDPGDLECKHRVFLCHSGAQKGFVEQLDKDLRRVDRYPFFDKDRESLPIGDNFPSLIFQAIKRCQVGVVFLSEEFFERGPWPMFEVVEMVECGRRIMPIFLGIAPGDLSEEKKVAEWKSKWEVWAKSNWRVDVARWESTLRSLRPLNGLVYNYAIGEVKFREEIVKEVCKIVPPFHVWDDSHVQGRSRISEIIQVKISETPMSEKGLQVVGLYGVGGIGKTTACKSLCKDLYLEFDGRVCHIEFGDDTSEIDRVREVLKRLTDTDNEFLRARNLDECWSRLKDLLPLNGVVLAIDNVSSSRKICDEVGKYISLKHGQGSVMMVTARGLGELRNLGIETDNCLPMPELVKAEARDLFLDFAKPESEVDERIVMECVKQCYFGKGDDDGSRHYHPLALKVLGSEMVGIHPLEWKSQLKKDVFNQLQEDENPVFSVLRRSFDSLKDEYKMLFMDVALFNDGVALWESRTYVYYEFEFSPIVQQRLSWYTIFDWLSIVHGITSVDEVKERLNVLKKRALLEELGDGRDQIGMHDLWREFAVIETKRGKEDEFPWVYEKSVPRGVWRPGLERRQVSCMFGGGWKKLRRFVIEDRRLRSINFSKCLKVTVLRLINVYVENGALDISHLKSIKSLEIVYRGAISGWLRDKIDRHRGQVSGIGQLVNLAVLILLDINRESISAVKEISCLTNLQILYLSLGTDSMSLDLQQLRYLQDVRICIPRMVSISGFSSRMKGLRILDLADCCDLRSCAGVGDVNGLEVLYLRNCGKLQELPNLRKLIRLRILDIVGCELLKTLPGLGSLVALQMLCGAHACLAMQELPSMSNLAKLEVLNLMGCEELKCIPGLGNLVALRELKVWCRSLHDLPDRGNLTKLQSVTICGSSYVDDCDAVSGNVLNLAMFESVSSLYIEYVDYELSNLSKLTALTSLEIVECYFERLPHMGSDMILVKFMIFNCRRLRGWDGVRALGTGPDCQVDISCDWTLPYLEKIKVSGCESLELPDLRHFPQLRCLDLRRWGSCDSFRANPVVQSHGIHKHLETLELRHSLIRELPDLSHFPSLQTFVVEECNILTNLAISEPLSALRHFHLGKCANLRTVPDIDLFPRLSKFSFLRCGVPVNTHEYEKLIARGFRQAFEGVFFAKSPLDLALLLANRFNWHADEGPSRFEPCTGEFIPYNVPLSEFGKKTVPERVLELGSSSGSGQEQTKRLKK